MCRGDSFGWDRYVFVGSSVWVGVGGFVRVTVCIEVTILAGVDIEPLAMQAVSAMARISRQVKIGILCCFIFSQNPIINRLG